MKTRITELLNIRHPIIQGGMIWNAGWRLATAVSDAGGLGLIGSGSMKPEIFIQHVQKAKEASKKPFGVNIPLIYDHVDEIVKICLNEGIKIIFTSAGSPKKYTADLKKNGVIVFHVVSTPELAKKVEDAGVDGVVAEGFEAGGHNGRDEITTMVLVPQVVNTVKIPVIAAGGIASGRQMAAALCLGAEGVQIGSRFAATNESSGHISFKEAILKAAPTDTFLVLKKIVPVRIIKNKFCLEVMKREEHGEDTESLREFLGKGRARRGMFEGDIEEGELEVGQVSGMINNIYSAKDVLTKIVNECKEILSALKISKVTR